MPKFKFPSKINDWTQQFLKPGVDPARLDQSLTEIRLQTPLPVFWLLGKTQSGKSSIIQALTGSTRAEIGEGFKPCTHHSDTYDFPDEATAFIRFLDTRGLGEVGYDPTDDMGYCEQRSSLLIMTLKASDHQQDEVLQVARKIRKSHPDWPIIIAQTCLHEVYPSSETEHPLPYPFCEARWAEGLHPRIALALSTQRKTFEGLGAQFVVLDFTLPEDGYEPVYYGLDALWSAIEEALPTGFARMMKETRDIRQSFNDIYSRETHPHIVGYAISAGLLGAIPVPGASIPLVVATQAKLFHSIASIYGLPLNTRCLSEVGSAVGVGGLMAGYGARELAKLVPGWGEVVAGLTTAAITYALGKTLDFYYAQTLQGAAFTPAMLRTVYKQELLRGRELLKQRFSATAAANDDAAAAS